MNFPSLNNGFRKHGHRRFFVPVISLTAFLLAVLLVLCFILFYKKPVKEPQVDKQLQDYQRTTYRLRTKKRELEREINRLTEEYEKITLGETTVLLCLNDASSTLYTDTFPFLKEYPVMFTVSKGLMPDDAGCITSAQYTQMVQNGWQPLLGGNCPTTPQALAQWKKQVSDELKTLKKKKLLVPTGYSFFTGCEDEFRPQVLKALKEFGMDYCNWPYDVYFYFGDFAEEDVTVIPSYAILQSTESNVSAVLSMLQDGDSVIVSTQSLLDTVADDLKDVSFEKFGLMLDYLKENDWDTKIKTFEGLRQYRLKITNDESAKALDAQITEAKKKSEQINREILDSVSAIK